MKQYIKHNLQNKLHRCADPGDLIKLDQLVERVDREGGHREGLDPKSLRWAQMGIDLA